MALAATNHQCMWLWGHPPPENFEFSKPCEGISKEIWEEFSQNNYMQGRLILEKFKYNW